MKMALIKRLDELEKIIKHNKDLPIWVNGNNNIVRVNIGHKRGKDITFPTAYDARLWIEKQINVHPGGIINYCVDNLTDLAEDAPTLRGVIRDILAEKIVVPQTTGLVIGGKIQPLIFDADDNFPGILFCGAEPGRPADLTLWCLASLIKQYFSFWQFKDRWKADQLSEDDKRMFLACFAVFAWNRPGETVWLKAEFLQFFLQATKLSPSGSE
jgi:hypothetical protein